jgi:hypothetical protein
MSTMSYRQVADYVKQRQRLRLRSMTEPDEDWHPELFLLRAERLHQHPVPVGWFGNRATKQALTNEVIVPLIRIGRVRIVALQVTMFMLRPEHPVGQLVNERYAANPDESPTAGLPRFQDIEGTEEHLWVHVFDAERYEGWTARITRPERGAPQLARFELLGGPDAMVGDLIDPIKAALR